MGKFFNCLVSEDLIKDWASTLDWLFDDLKFSAERNWNGGYTSSFTKKVKELKYFVDNKNCVKYSKCKGADFPNQSKKRRRECLPLIVMSQKESFARDLIRHIRNGIAHGNTAVHKVKGELFIEIIDYTDKSKSPDKQSAYLFLPLSYITQFYKIYEGINKSIMHTKRKDRDVTKKLKKGA